MRCPVCGCTLISIHALLAESDKIPYATSELILEFLSTLSLRRATALQPSKLQGSQYFYPRSPCGERQGSHVNGCKKSRFLSTLSLRRATPQHTKRLLQPRNFYPRSPCGERHGACGQLDFAWVFLSTLSLRRATPLSPVVPS